MAYIIGNNTSQRLVGTYLYDYIQGLDGNDTILGGFGADWLYGDSGTDILFGGFQDDRLYGGVGNDTLHGESGDDYFQGGAGADQMLGGAGRDTFDQTNLAETAGDQVFGGAGIDRLLLDFGVATGPVNFFIQDPTVTVTLRFGGAAFRFSQIEEFDITGTNFADRLTGWHNEDELEGGAGNDVLNGGLGDDILRGDDGNDFLRGGGDDDLLYGGLGNDTLWGDEGADGIEGGSGNDNLNGGNGDDRMEGGAGSDTLAGGLGNDVLDSYQYGSDDDLVRDVLSSGAGNDLIWMGINDQADGGTGLDHVYLDFTSVTGPVTWTFSPGLKQFGNGTRIVNMEQLTYDGGSGRDVVTGWNLDDNLSGNAGNDSLSGGNGHDTLDGGLGSDVLVGGLGNDVLNHEAGNDALYGQAGNDTFNIGFDENAAVPYPVLMDGGAGYDQVNFTSWELGAVVDLINQGSNDGLAKGKVLRGIEALEGTYLDDRFLGTNARDVLGGGSGSDELNGRAGNDLLAGGSGSDILTGGLGADVFDFTDYSGGWEGDVITDFQRGQDVMRFDAVPGLRLINGLHPTTTLAGPVLIFETDTKRLWFDADGQAAAEGPQLIATIERVAQLSLGDFQFV